MKLNYYFDSYIMHNNMISSKSKKIWWSKLKSSFSSKKGILMGKESSLRGKLNVNEEYKEVLRTKSYMDIWSKVQAQLKRSPNTTTTLDEDPLSPSPSTTSSSSSTSFSSCSSSFNSSPLPFYINLSDLLLEPRQEAVIDVIKSSNLQTLLVDYFDASFEACNICELLLKGIHKTRSNHRIIKRAINSLSQGINEQDYEEEQGLLLSKNDEQYQELASFSRLSNPLSSIINDGEVDFSTIRENYSLLLRKLISERKKMKKKEKFTRLYKMAAWYGFIATYIVLAIALLTLATHSMVGLLGAPGLLLPFSMDIINRVKGGESIKVNFLKQLGSQLDVAAKGVYIFINDFDTVGRLVTRLHDEVEHKREMAEMCVRMRMKNGKISHEVVMEALKDIQMHEVGFQEQLQELEEHIYLCFLTINRSRRLVLEEILSPLNNNNNNSNSISNSSNNNNNPGE